MNNRVFGIVMLILAGFLLWFVSTGALVSAPLLVIFAALGSLGGVGLAIWALLGKY